MVPAEQQEVFQTVRLEDARFKVAFSYLRGRKIRVLAKIFQLGNPDN